MRLQRGFSLIEVLIVVAIILVIAAIAIPNLLTARLRANESAAVATLRTINTSQTTYQMRYNTYADTLTKLGGNPNAPTPAAAGLIDFVLGCPAQPCPKSGFQFAVVNTVVAPNGDIVGYQLNAWPLSASTGQKSFCSDELSKMAFDPNAGNPPVCTQPVQ
jgi:prepilin-type N-terminal cleavage/methylation domain-containing protein